MAVIRRTVGSRTSKPGVYRKYSDVAFRRRRVLSANSNNPIAGPVTFAGAGSMSTNPTAIRSDTVGWGGVGSMAADPGQRGNAAFAGVGSLVNGPVVQTYAAQVNWGGSGFLSADGTRIGPLVAVRIAPAKAIDPGPVAGSKVSYSYTLTAAGQSVTVETSIDNGATYQLAINGEPVPRLPRGSTTARAVLSRTTLTRAVGTDPSPRLHYLKVHVDVDSTINEYVPLGVFTINETDITEGDSSTDGSNSNSATNGGTSGQSGAQGNGLEIEVSGSDFSRRISRNAWETIYTIPAGTNFGDAIQQVASNRLPGLTFNFASTDVVTGTIFTFGAQGTNDPWADLLDMAEAIGMELFFDARGILTMRPEPNPDFDTPVWYFSDKANPTVIDLSRRITDDDTYNYVIVTGESSGTTTPAFGVAVDTDPASPTYYLGPYGTNVYRITSALVTTDEQAVTMAQAILLRRTGATEIVEFDAVPMAAIEHGDVVGLERSKAGITGKLLVDGTTVPLGADLAEHFVTRRHNLAASRPPGGGVGGLDPGGDGGGGGSFTPDSFTFAFSSCSNRDAGSGGDDSSAYVNIRNAKPDYFCHLGDVWYDDGSSNHLSHWNAAFSSPNYAALIASLPNPQIINWSDHDATFSNNGTGVGNSVVAAGNAAYRTKFTGLDLPDNGIYRTWTRGRIRFILLDCITFKDPESKSDTTGKTMLGSVQKAWLKNLIASNDYPMIVMLGDSQWPGPKEAGQDEWRGYDTERQEMASSFGASPATLIYLNGDTHSLAYGHDQFGLERLWQASPLKNNTKVKAAGAGYIDTYPLNKDEGDVAHQYAIISFVDDGTTLTATCRFYSEGALKMTDSVTA